MTHDQDARGIEPVLVQDRRAPGSTPVFSVIIALYNAESCFEATIASLMSQTVADRDLEFIVVNDGSTDSSLEIARKWARRDPRVVLVTKENEGIGWTRRTALSYCRGTWVTSVDPDDLVSREYFEEVQKMIRCDTADEVALYTSRVLITNGETGVFKDSHPLGAKFRRGNRVISLEVEPNAVQLGATCFMRRAVLESNHLTFEPEIRPTFEDGHLICRYLGQFERPLVGLVATARYFYRKRADGSSAVQSGWRQIEKFTVQPSAGYVDALATVNARAGRTPNWLAMAILYDLMWYFKEYHRQGSSVRWVPDDARAEFMSACDSIFSFISWEQLLELKVNTPRFSLREAIGLGFGMCEAKGRLFKWGTRNGRTNWTLELGPSAEVVEVFHRGIPVLVEPDGIMEHEYFGRVLMREYTFEMDEGDLAVFIDGQPLHPSSAKVSVRDREEDPRAAALTDAVRTHALVQTDDEKRLERLRVVSGITNRSLLGVAADKLKNRVTQRGTTAAEEARDIVAEAKALLGGDPSKYEGCWLILDHADKADDNAEHLYRYLMVNRQDIEAYFLLRPDSKDWARLHDEGFQLLEYGSAGAIAAATRAKVVASSDAVGECMHLIPRGMGCKASYKFVFLQHGVSEKDISDWLNDKAIDLCIAVTPREYEAFVWRGSKYRFKAKQVALTGFPRFDRLFNESRGRRKQSTDGPRALLIMPTWRRSLKLELDEARDDRHRAEILQNSPFIGAWLALLRSEMIRRLIENNDLRVRFIAHPNLVEFQHLLDIPDWIEVLDPWAQSFQDLIVSADFFLSDYSSLIFDVAYAGGKVAYYQFDRDQMGSGIHSWTPGYFDYESMGLGPVYGDPSLVERWIEESIAGRFDAQGVYSERVTETFAYVDNRNCERVVEAIEHMILGDTASIVEKARPFVVQPVLSGVLSLPSSGAHSPERQVEC